MNQQTGKPMHIRIPVIAVVLGSVVLVLAACSSSQQSQTATTISPTGTPVQTSGSSNHSSESALALVHDAFANMMNAESLHFEVRDSIPEFRIVPIEGDYVLGDGARGVLQSNDEGTLEWLTWRDFYFVRKPGEDKYRYAGGRAPAGVFLTFDQLADVELNILSATDLGEEEVDGANTTYVKIIYDMKAFPEFAFLSPEGKGRLDVWIGNDMRYIHKLGFSSWTTDLPRAHTYYSRFNEPVVPPIGTPAVDVPSLPHCRHPLGSQKSSLRRQPSDPCLDIQSYLD